MRVHKPIGGGEPVGSWFVDQRGQVGTAAQRVGDARRTRQQRVVPRSIVVGAGPQHGAVVACASPAPSRGRAATVGHRWSTNAAVPGAQPVVPHAGGDVRAHVGVELGLLDACRRAGSSSTSCRRHAGCRRATRRRARPRRGSRRRRAPSPSRRGSTDRNARRGTTGSCRCRAAARRSTRRSRTISSAEITPSRSGSCGMTVDPLGGLRARTRCSSCRARATRHARRPSWLRGCLVISHSSSFL